MRFLHFLNVFSSHLSRLTMASSVSYCFIKNRDHRRCLCSALYGNNPFTRSFCQTILHRKGEQPKLLLKRLFATVFDLRFRVKAPYQLQSFCATMYQFMHSNLIVMSGLSGFMASAMGLVDCCWHACRIWQSKTWRAPAGGFWFARLIMVGRRGHEGAPCWNSTFLLLIGVNCIAQLLCEILTLSASAKWRNALKWQ